VHLSLLLLTWHAGNMSVLVNSLNPTASRHKFKKDMVANTVRCAWAASAD